MQTLIQTDTGADAQKLGHFLPHHTQEVGNNLGCPFSVMFPLP